jgi:hypothetical protein
MPVEQTEEAFLKDVAQHEMTVLLDNGVYRHLRFSNSEKKYAWNQWFEIVTWPGFLAFSGDMGCFVFTRLKDMFEFFRTHPEKEKGLYINPGYWAEKLEAVDNTTRSPGCKQFSESLFRSEVDEHVKQWIKEWSLDKSQRKALRDAIRDDVFSHVDDGEHEARKALNDFSCEITEIDDDFGGVHVFKFEDTWEWNFQEYTGRFIWCCYALAWSIKQYDALKEAQAVTA